MESSDDHYMSNTESDQEMEAKMNLAKEKALGDDEFSCGNCCSSYETTNDAAANEAKLIMRDEELEEQDEFEQFGASALVNSEHVAASTTASASQSPLEKLIQKQRLELTMELRRLQFGERPVSNTNSKNRLEEFFTSALNTEATQRTRDPSQFRSDVTRNEIESLSSQRRVSNVLSTARQALENTLQRYVDSAASRRPQTTIINIPPPPPPASAVPVPTARPVVPPSNIAQAAAYTNGLQNSQNSVLSNVSSNIVIQSSDGSTNLLQPVTAWIPVVATNNQPAAQAQQQQQPVEPQAPWLGRPENLFNAIENVRRQQIIDEISELVHQQLVTQSLESAFRTRLEQRVLQHLQNSGTDGERTRNFVQSIAQTNHVERNDFSHLGIFENAGRNDIDNLDSASTYQSAHQSQHRHQQQAARQSVIQSREIRTLQNEISELKNMMKLSFELQLDMQRSLRQEVAALIAGTFIKQDSNTQKNQTQTQQRQQQRVQQARASVLTSNQPSNEGNCLICTEGKVDTVFYKCGHMCACYTCSMRLKQTSGNCPVCRAPIVDILRTYKCNLD